MKLKRVLTLRTVVATSAGLTLASSSFIAAAQVAGFLVGDSAWISILIGGGLCLLAGACFSELNDILPSAAGIRLYLGKAFGEKTALTVSIMYMLVVLGVVGAESFVLANILSFSVPAVMPVIWITLMMGTVTVLNIRGIKLAGNFQDIITYGLIISFIVMSIWGLKKVDFELTAPFATGGAANLASAIAVGIFLFVGFEWVTPLAEEVTNSKLISRGMFIAVGIVAVVYALFTVAMTANVPREILATTPVPQIVFAREIMGGMGIAWILAISLASSITTFNAGLLSVSRFFYATAREQALPRIFSKVSMRFMTPWVSVLAVFAVGYTFSIIILYTREYLVLVNLAAAAECVIYVLSAIAVLVLRRKMADAPRSFKVPWGPVIPVATAVIFALLAVMVFVTSPMTAVFMAVGLLITWIYVIKVVPVLREKYRVRRPSRRHERPSAREAAKAVPGAAPPRAAEKSGDKL